MDLLDALTLRTAADDLDRDGGEAVRAAATARVLRLTPLSTLVRLYGEAELVRILASAPQLHDRLRTTWNRQDRLLAAQLFSWAEQARLHQDRTDGRARPAASWMQERDLAPAA